MCTEATAFKEAYQAAQAKLPRTDDQDGDEDEDAEEGPAAPEVCNTLHFGRVRRFNSEHGVLGPPLVSF